MTTGRINQVTIIEKDTLIKRRKESCNPEGLQLILCSETVTWEVKNFRPDITSLVCVHCERIPLEVTPSTLNL